MLIRIVRGGKGAVPSICARNSLHGAFIAPWWVRFVIITDRVKKPVCPLGFWVGTRRMIFFAEAVSIELVEGKQGMTRVVDVARARRWCN